MKALANTRHFVNKLLCLALSFTLAFSMMGTSAFASELASAANEETPDTQAVSAPAVSEPAAPASPAPTASTPSSPAADTAQADAPSQPPASEDESTQNEEGDVEEGIVPAEEGTEEEGAEDGDDSQDEWATNPLSASLDVSYDSANHVLHYTVHVSNSSAKQIEGLYVYPMFSATQDIELSPFRYETDQFEYNIPAHGAVDVSFSVDVPHYDVAEAPVVACTANASFSYYQDGNVEDLQWYEVDAVASITLPQSYSALFDIGISTTLYNALGELSYEDYAYPGNVVEFTYSVTNAGTAPISGAQLVAYKTTTSEPLVFAAGGEGSLDPNSFDIDAGQTVSFVARYVVTNQDVIDELVTATVQVTANGTTKQEEYDACKVGNEFEYFVSYYRDDADGEGLKLLETIPLGFAGLGDEVSLEPGTEKGQPDWLKPEVGYSTKWRPIKIDSKAEGNVIRVVYSKNLYSYVINYYQDSIDPKNLLAADEAFTGRAYFGQQVALNETELNRHKPDEYAWLEKGSVAPLTISSDESQNVINVVYAKKNDYEYRINYYRDSIDPGNLLNDGSVQDVFTAPFGSEVTLTDDDQRNAMLPPGYAPLAVSDVSGITIKSDKSENVIDVVYKSKNSYRYTINYFYGDIKAVPDATESDVATFGSEVEIDYDLANKYRLPGYDAVEGGAIASISINPDENVFNVVYPKTENIPYVINYYVDNDSAENFIESDLRTGTFDETILLSLEDLNKYLPPVGYQPIVTVDSFSVGADPLSNVFNVVYQRKSYSYIIEYYKNEIVNDREVSTYIDSEVSKQKLPYDSEVIIDAATLNKYLPQGANGAASGYYAKTDDDAVAIRIGEGSSANTVQVTYELKSFDYTVNYYRDSISDANLIKGASIHDSSKYGAILPFFNDVLNAYLPAGYTPLEGQRFLPITSDPSANVLNIVYSDKQKQLPYRIEYYLDSADGTPVDSYEDIGSFGDRIVVVPYAQLPEGYNTTPTSVLGSHYINTTIEESVMKVVYTKNSYGYMVNYYRDSIDPDNLIQTEEGTAVLDTPIPLNLNAHVPEGYDPQSIEMRGITYISTDASKNVVDIVYTGAPRIPYTVKYYAGSTTGTLLKQFSDVGAVGDQIPYDVDFAVPLGYSASPELSGGTTITEDSAANVLNVVFPPNSYGFTVNYYHDEVAPDNLVETDTGYALYNSSIPYINGAHVPTGYDAAGLVSGPRNIHYDASQNVINVVYKPARFTYTINYYRGSVSPRNLISSATQEPRLFGTLVEISADELNYFMPEGYERLVDGTFLTITENAANNTVNIVFTPDFTSFYNTAIEPLSVTYDGSMHYLSTPKGLYEGDIITYSYNGVVQTRVVGEDSNIAAGFEDVTNGDMPVTITLTRAGVSSSAVVAAVNIAPVPVVTPPVTEEPVRQPEGNFEVVTDGIIEAVVAPIVGAIGSIVTPSYGDLFVAETVTNLLTETIDDDANPLANMRNLQLASELDMQTSPLEFMSYLLILLGALCVFFTVLLLLMRRRAIEHDVVLKGESLAVLRSRARALTVSSLVTALLGVCFFIFWCVLRF